jgi:MFS family permease
LSSVVQKRPWSTVSAVSLGWLFGAVDIILLILFQEEIAADLAVELQTVRIAIGVGLMGSAFGGLFFAQLGDRLGRVRALAISIIIYSVATGLMAFASSKLELFGLRFIAGIGTGAEWSIGFALLSEVWSPKSRGAVGGLVAAMFNLGTFVAIILFHSSLGWRWSFGIMVVPAFFAIILRRIIPESPVWLKFSAARKAGDLSDQLKQQVKRPPIVAAFRGTTKWLTLRTTLIFAVMNLGFYSFSTVFINFLKASPSDGGGLGLTKAEQLPFHLALNIAGLLSVILAGWLSDRIGRRRAFVGFCMIGVSGFLWLSLELAELQGSGPNAVTYMLIAAFAVCCMGFGVNGVMGVFTPELFPTYLRSTGPGVSQNIGKGIGGLLGPTLAGALVATQGYQFVLGLPLWVFLAIGILIWTLPEVGGRDLADNANQA